MSKRQSKLQKWRVVFSFCDIRAGALFSLFVTSEPVTQSYYLSVSKEMSAGLTRVPCTYGRILVHLYWWRVDHNQSSCFLHTHQLSLVWKIVLQNSASVRVQEYPVRGRHNTKYDCRNHIRVIQPIGNGESALCLRNQRSQSKGSSCLCKSNEPWETRVCSRGGQWNC